MRPCRLCPQDGDGSISFRELVISLRGLDLCLDDAEVQLLMDLMEVTGTDSAVNTDAFSDYVDAGAVRGAFTGVRA